MPENKETYLKDALQRRLNLTRRQIKSRLKNLQQKVTEAEPESAAGVRAEEVQLILSLFEVETSLRKIEKEGRNA